MKLLLAIFMMISSLYSFCLEVDEKLPLRILRTSRSKKTILINRGLEDGLVKGNHAKFFLTKGVVARGVVVKAAPTRTVWALYRVIDAEEVRTDRVMNLKVATPVKLTEDPTKMLSHEDLPQYNRGRIKYYNNTTIPYYDGRVAPVYKGEAKPEYYYYGVPVAKGGVDVEEQELAALESNDGKQLEDYAFSDREVFSREVVDNNQIYTLHDDWEINTNFFLNALSSSVSTDDSSNDFSGELSTLDFSFGIEKYFPHSSSWLRRFSIGGFYHRATQDTGDINGEQVSSDVAEWGGNLSYHFQNPFIVEQFSWYTNFTLGVASITDDYNSQTRTETDPVKGGGSFWGLGLGFKYLTKHSFGFKMLLDYYRRTELFEFDDSGNVNRVVSGPRMVMGIFYRW